MKGKAVAIYEDNGESVCVELPAEQQLLDQIYELEQDALLEINRWQSRHASVSAALTVSATINAMVLVIWIWRSL